MVEAVVGNLPNNADVPDVMVTILVEGANYTVLSGSSDGIKLPV